MTPGYPVQSPPLTPPVNPAYPMSPVQPVAPVNNFYVLPAAPTGGNPFPAAPVELPSVVLPNPAAPQVPLGPLNPGISL